MQDEDGQAMVEFALVLPLLLVLVMGMLDFGRALNYWIDETHLANQAARFAAVNRVPTDCGGEDLQSCIQAKGTTAELRDGTGSVTNALSVCIEYPDGEVVGSPVKVTASASYHFMAILGWFGDPIPDVDINGTATMRLEAKPTNVPAGCNA